MSPARSQAPNQRFGTLGLLLWLGLGPGFARPGGGPRSSPAPASAAIAAVPAVVRAHRRADQTWMPSGEIQGANAMILRQISTRRLLPDGSIASRTLTEFKVLTALGAQQLTNFPLFYRGDATLTAVHAFVLNGQQVQTPAPDAVHDYATRLAQAAPMYTDLRERILTLPSLRAGSLVAIEFRSTLRREDEPGELTALWSPSQVPVLSRQVTILLPPGRQLKFAEAPLLGPGAKQMVWGHSKHASAAGVEYSFRWANVPAADSEPYSPPQPPVFAASTFAGWNAVARWYYQLAEPQTLPSATIRAEAARLTAGLAAREAKIRAIYDYVAANFRYVSLSFGVGRYRPHAAAQVLQNGYGDCKDKAALLIALLRSAGIRADFALLDAGGRIQRAVPSVQGFDHVIVAVPGASGYQFLDATVPQHFGSLLGDAGHWALLVRAPGAAGSALVRIPPATAAATETVETDNIRAESDGNMSADCILRLGPALALISRLALHYTPPASLDKTEALLARATASETRLVSFQATPWPGLDQPFTMHTVRRMTAEALVLKPPFSVPLWWHIVARSLPAPKHHRRQPLRLDRLLPAYHQIIHLSLPPGFVPVLPAATELTPGFARFSLHYGFNAPHHLFTADAELLWLQPELPASRVAAYQRFQQAVSNAEVGAITLTLAPSAAPAALAASLRQVHQDLVRGSNAAVTLGQALVAAAPENALAREDLASALLAGQKYRQALAALQPLAAHPPASSRVPALLAQAHLGLGQAATALPEAQAQLAATPYDAAATGLEGRILDALGRRPAAVQAYARAVQLAPASAEWHYHLGQDQMALGQRSSAEANFTAVAAAPDATATELLAMAAVELAAGKPESSALSWAEQGTAETGAALASLDWTQLTTAQIRAMARMPGAIELCARLRAQGGHWRAASALGRLAVALSPGQAAWVARLARWEGRAAGPAAALPYWAYLLRQPRPPSGAMQGLLRAYQALPQHPSLPPDLYLVQHPDLAQPRFGGLTLSPASPPGGSALVWISGGRAASFSGYLPAAEEQQIQAATFPAPVIGGSPVTYVLNLEPGPQTAIIVPAGSGGPR